MPADPPELLDDEAAAKYIHMSVDWLRISRSSGHKDNWTPSPRFLRLGRKIRYRKADLDEWLEARVEDPAARKAAAVTAVTKGRKGALPKAREKRAA